MNGMAKKRCQNYKKQPIEMKFNTDFSGTLQQYGLDADRWKTSTPNTPSPNTKAAIIREKGPMVSVRWLMHFVFGRL